MMMKRACVVALLAGAVMVGGCQQREVHATSPQTHEDRAVPPGAIPADPNASLLDPTVPVAKKAPPATAGNAAATAATPADSAAADSSHPAG
ncbi:MAG TPA: hypothetical protein VFL93_15615 [Longimicrobiaceae bacterium]|nr:hypothetical protein [Longimicrobiaceae bacterium]